MASVPGRWLALTAAMLLLVGCGGKSTQKQEIKIGIFGSLTGTTARFGQSAKDGALLAIDQINQRGGVLGKQLKPIVHRRVTLLRLLDDGRKQVGQRLA